MYVDIQKVIYGLPQADKIANDKLKQYMAKFGYDQVPNTLHGDETDRKSCFITMYRFTW